MLLIKIALVVLIAWEICERWVWPKIKKQDPPGPGGLSTKVICIDTCHAESAYKHDQDAVAAAWCDQFRFGAVNETRRRAMNKRSFLRELEDFCLDEGLDLEVWEDYKFDALGIRLHDKKTNRAMQARVKRRNYEDTPIASANRIKRAWEAGAREKPGIEIQVPKEQQEAVLQAVKDYTEKEGIKVTYSKGEPQERPAGFFEEFSIHTDWRKK